MSLLEELKDKREQAADWKEDQERRKAGLLSSVDAIDFGIRETQRQIDDIDKAIAALEPQTVEPVRNEWAEPALPESVTEITGLTEPVVIELETDEPQIPEGFTPWSGTANDGPIYDVSPMSRVEVLFRSGQVQTGERGDFGWMPIGAASDIIAYRIISDAERIEDESQAETATEQTPSPEAAYAPVNGEGLMWAAGFKADFTAKAAEPAPEAKRPFWMFTKDPVDA